MNDKNDSVKTQIQKSFCIPLECQGVYPKFILSASRVSEYISWICFGHSQSIGISKLKSGKPNIEYQTIKKELPRMTTLQYLAYRIIYESNAFTLSATAFPSAFPANCFEAIPITLPISFIDEAPVSVIIFWTAAVSSSSLIWAGK